MRTSDPTTRMKRNGRINPLLEYTNISGTLQLQGNQISVTGAISVTKDGSATITIDPVPLNETTKWILGHVPGKGRLATRAALHATTPEKKTITSDYVHVNSRTDHIGTT